MTSTRPSSMQFTLNPHLPEKLCLSSPFFARLGVQFVALSWGHAGLLNTFLPFRTRLYHRALERESMSPRKLLALLCLCFALSFAANSNAQTKLLRFPDIHGDKVVFTYAGDLWLASTSSGLATR